MDNNTNNKKDEVKRLLYEGFIVFAIIVFSTVAVVITVMDTPDVEMDKAKPPAVSAINNDI